MRLISFKAMIFGAIIALPQLAMAAESVNSAKLDAVAFSSGERQVRLVELFTSQGCSSCPPAERWLNRFVEDGLLWTHIVPVAFHVDYWDYLGWSDPYADSAYSSRQRLHRAQGNTRAVYTPGFVVNGEEWRGWFSHLPLADDNPPAAVLDIHIDGDRLSAQYATAEQDLILNIAVLGFGIKTPIAAGENHGRTLPQEFVVLAHRMAGSDNGEWQMQLPQVAIEQLGVQRTALAAWVSETDNLRPLQATGGWLPTAYLN